MRRLSLAFTAFAVVRGASAVNFAAAPAATSLPKFSAGGVVTMKSASMMGGDYDVSVLPYTMPKSGNFAWDFYAMASPGATLESAILTFTFSGTPSAQWTTTTGAKYMAPGGEYSIPSSIGSMTALGTMATQRIDLSAYKESKWHLSATDTFILPMSATITSVTAHVIQTVPEPTSLAALGLGGFGLLRRRRRG